jgi:hypothetical protein
MWPVRIFIFCQPPLENFVSIADGRHQYFLNFHKILLTKCNKCNSVLCILCSCQTKASFDIRRLRRCPCRSPIRSHCLRPLARVFVHEVKVVVHHQPVFIHTAKVGSSSPSLSCCRRVGLPQPEQGRHSSPRHPGRVGQALRPTWLTPPFVTGCCDGQMQGTCGLAWALGCRLPGRPQSLDAGGSPFMQQLLPLLLVLGLQPHLCLTSRRMDPPRSIPPLGATCARAPCIPGCPY